MRRYVTHQEQNEKPYQNIVRGYVSAYVLML